MLTKCTYLCAASDIDHTKITPKDLEDYIYFPSLWTGIFDIEAYHEVPMHLIFLNIYKTFLLQIKLFLKAKLKFTLYSKCVKDKLSDLTKMQLEWLKILDYNENGNYSSYISQTYMAHARINRWFQNHMRDINGLNEFTNNEPFEFDVSISKRNNPNYLYKNGFLQGV